MSPVESKQLARLEGVRELLTRSEHAVLFSDRAARDELCRDDALVVVELGGERDAVLSATSRYASWADTNLLR